MFPYKFPNAASYVISVTNTATRLLTLINTAAGATISFPYDLSIIELSPEDGDIRYTDNDAVPTAANGKLLVQGGSYSIETAPVNVQLIRTGGANVAVNVRVGWIRRG